MVGNQTNKNEILKSSATDPVRSRRSGRSGPTRIVDVKIYPDSDTILEVRSLPVQN